MVPAEFHACSASVHSVTPALPAGSTWTDPYSNLRLTLNAVSATATTVTVNYAGVTCTTAAPTVTAAPAAVSSEYGAAAQFTVTVRNNSSTGCPSETFNLAATTPSGWTSSFGSTALSLVPGAQASTTFRANVPSSYPLGTYAVSVRSTSTTSAKAGSGSANVTVVQPTHRLTVNLGGGGSVRLSTPSRTCTSSCTQDYTGASTSVTLTATASTRNAFAAWSGACTGTASTCTVTMSVDRTVTATFKRASRK